MKTLLTMLIAFMVVVSPAVIAKEQPKAKSAAMKVEQTKKAPTTATQNAKVNINTASAKELATLAGIGEAKAKAIVEYRKANGKFNNAKDLEKVKGIGTSIVAGNISRIKL